MGERKKQAEAGSQPTSWTRNSLSNWQIASISGKECCVLFLSMFLSASSHFVPLSEALSRPPAVQSNG